MKDREFIIENLFNAWSWNDIIDESTALIFCQEELDVPLEYIDGLQCHHQSIKLVLCRDKTYRGEDWYVNLIRHAS